MDKKKKIYLINFLLKIAITLLCIYAVLATLILALRVYDEHAPRQSPFSRMSVSDVDLNYENCSDIYDEIEVKGHSCPFTCNF